MAEDKPRPVRLASVLTHLLSKRIATANDIAEKYGISIRTVYRDITEIYLNMKIIMQFCSI